MVVGRPKLCFVIGPIGEDGSDERKHADNFLNALVKDVVRTNKLGYHVSRADEVAEPGMITDAVIRDLIKAPIVIADLTFLNANAFYEVGIRHALHKPIIHFAQKGTNLPFNIRPYRTIVEDISDWHGLQKAKEQLHNNILFIEDPTFKVSNPVIHAQLTYGIRTIPDPHENMALGEIQRKFQNETGGRSLSENLELLIEQYKETRSAAQSALSDLKSANRAGEDIAPYRERWERLKLETELLEERIRRNNLDIPAWTYD